MKALEGTVHTRMLISLVIGGFLLGASAMADEWSNSPLGKTTFGELWMGPALSADALEGSVVVIEFWGVHCGPCIASLPHMSQLASTLSSQGLLVIGCHAQGPAKDEAIAICTRQGVNYTIYANGNVPGKMGFPGIPHVFVFDHNGQIIFEGHPAEMDAAVQKALAARPNPLLGDMKYIKLASAATMVKAGRLGSALKECQKNKEKDADTAREAAYLTARLDKHIKKLQAKADGDRELAPAAVVEGLTALKQQLDGTDIAVKASETLKTLSADKDFQKSLAAEKEYKIISGALRKIGWPGSAVERDAWAKRNGSAIKQIATRIEAMKKAYPANKLTARIEVEFKTTQGG
jgi:thiol-disulfide isomerase/thioredoxin